MSRELIENLTTKAGGKFRLTALVQKRLQELSRAAQQPIETGGGDLINTALHEIAGRLDNKTQPQFAKTAAAQREPEETPSDSQDGASKPKRRKKNARSTTKKAAKKTKKKAAKKAIKKKKKTKKK